MAWWHYAGSLAAVALLVLLSWRLGFSGRPELLDEEEVRLLANGLPGGFAAKSMALDSAGGAAILQDEAGRIALIVPCGAHFIARPLGPGASATCDGETLVVTEGAGTTTLDIGPGASDWANAIRRLN